VIAPNRSNPHEAAERFNFHLILRNMSLQVPLGLTFQTFVSAQR